MKAAVISLALSGLGEAAQLRSLVDGNVRVDICEYQAKKLYYKTKTAKVADWEIAANYDTHDCALSRDYPRPCNNLDSSCTNPWACVVSEWSAWSACQSGGTQTRSRKATYEGKYGESCPVLVESQPCTFNGDVSNDDVPPATDDTDDELPNSEYDDDFTDPDKTKETTAEKYDAGFCRFKNYDQYQKCGTMGLNGYSFCQLNKEGSKLCFENFYCNEKFSYPCSSDKDCAKGYTCAYSACGNVCTPQCGVGLSQYGSHYVSTGECWDKTESRHLASSRASGAPLALHAPCTPGSGAVDAANMFHCDEATSTLVYRR